MGDDDHASEYMMTYGEGPGSETRMVLSSFVNDDEKVLDVGCGPGWNYDHFQMYGPNVKDYLGLDYSNRFVRVANQRNPGKYAYGDVRKIEQPDESWDVVILQDVLEHTNGFKKPLKEAMRVASKRVIVTFWHLTESDDHINDNPAENDLDGWGAWYSRPTWEAFLNTLPYVWFQTESYGEHPHDFYIIAKDSEKGLKHA